MTAPFDSRGLFEKIVKRLPEVIWVSDQGKNRIYYVSPAYGQIWGRTDESLYRSPRSWIDAIHPDDRDRVQQAALTRQTLGTYDEEYRIVRPDGSIRWIHDRAVPLHHEDGSIQCIIGIARDISARKGLEISLQESLARFSGVISIAADAIIMINEAQRIILFNQGAEQAFGYLASEVMGQPLDLLLPSRFTQIHQQHVRNFGAGNVSARLMGERRGPIFGRRKDGVEFPAEASISKWSRNGETIFTVIVRDSTEREQAEAQIRQLAYYDTLTGFPNRNHFQELINQAIIARQETKKTVAILLLDLNRFKEINDTLGHHRGDLLLQQVALRLKNVLRPSDTVARLGGDEFSLLLSLAAPEDAELVARKIQTVLEPPFEIEGYPIAVEASIGIALCPTHAQDANTLFQKADVAMYASKREGVGFKIYTLQLDRHSPRRLALMGELRQAINNDQLFLHFQPKIHLTTGRLVGVEALVRWQHPTLGVVPPGEFIMPAEQTGLIGPLTTFVLRTALEQCRIWQQATPQLSVSVNISVRNLLDPQLPKQIKELVQRFGIERECLDLEITESALTTNPQAMITTINSLSQLGFSLTIDDFGIGYSSLKYLKTLPVKAIKIDRSFVIEMLLNKGDEAIVRSTIDLAHNLGLNVVAEGVETREVLEKLKAIGCDMAQGYYISRPIPADDFIQWLNTSRSLQGGGRS